MNWWIRILWAVGLWNWDCGRQCWRIMLKDRHPPQTVFSAPCGVPADYKPREHKQSVVEIDGVAYPTPPQVAGLLHAVSEERDELLANAAGERPLPAGDKS